MCAALRVTALDPQNSKQVAAAQLLAKLKFGANVDQQPTIAINLPAPMSPEQFAKAVEVIDGHPTVVQSSMADTRTGGETEMSYTDVKYDVGLPEDIFTERYLRTPPRRLLR